AAGVGGYWCSARRRSPRPRWTPAWKAAARSAGLLRCSQRSPPRPRVFSVPGAAPDGANGVPVPAPPGVRSCGSRCVWRRRRGSGSCSRAGVGPSGGGGVSSGAVTDRPRWAVRSRVASPAAPIMRNRGSCAPYLITNRCAAGEPRTSPHRGRRGGHYAGRVPSETRPTLVVVGPPGAGKTTVGRVLARRLGVGFADADALIEERTGKSIPDLFVEDGEEGFRRIEREVVAEALRTHDGVLALGGGAVLSEQTRAQLREHRVVYLSVGLADGLRRTGMSTARPLLSGVNPRATFKALLDARAPLYKEVATVQVATDRCSPNQVARAVLAALGEAPASAPDDPAAPCRALRAARARLYKEGATVQVATARCSPSQVARAVLEALGEAPASAPDDPVDPDDPLDRPTPHGGAPLPDPTVRA